MGGVVETAQNECVLYFTYKTDEDTIMNINKTLKLILAALMMIMLVMSASAMAKKAIGDKGPAGGIVFYITESGAHGLEAAPADLPGHYEFGCFNVDIGTVGAMPTAIGSGSANTAEIVAKNCDPNIAGNLIAANAADAYTLNGKSDWFLPSKDELAMLYEQRAVVSGFADDLYWSSSEDGSNVAGCMIFYSGYQYFNVKSSKLKVRAVRVF